MPTSANTVISNVLNRSRDVDLETICSIDRMSDTGSPVACRSCSCTAPLSESGGTLVRMTHAIGEMRTLSAFTASGICDCGTNIFGPGS